MAGFRPSRVSTGNAVFVACEGLCVHALQRLCRASQRAVLYCYVVLMKIQMTSLFRSASKQPQSTGSLLYLLCKSKG